MLDTCDAVDTPLATLKTALNVATSLTPAIESSSPFMFGPQDGRIVLKKGGKKVQTEDFWIANDGKYMSDSNWNVAWETDRVTVTISGEEQPDDVHLLCYQSE